MKVALSHHVKILLAKTITNIFSCLYYEWNISVFVWKQKFQKIWFKKYGLEPGFHLLAIHDCTIINSNKNV